MLPKWLVDLGLTGESAGDFAAVIIKNQGYRGFEAGKIAGSIARETNATGKETEQILAVVLNSINPDPDEADQIASTVELETGEKVSVVRDTEVVEVPKTRKAEEGLPQNPLANMLSSNSGELVEHDLSSLRSEDPYLTGSTIPFQDKILEAPTSAALVQFYRDINEQADELIRESIAANENPTVVPSIQAVANGTTSRLTKAEALRRILQGLGINVENENPTAEEVISALLKSEQVEEEVVTKTSSFLFQ